MSTRHPGVSQGKQEFLEQVLRQNREIKLDEVNRAWNVAGHEGTISLSYFGKVKSDLGLTRPRGQARPAAGKPETAPKRASAPQATVAMRAPRSFTADQDAPEHGRAGGDHHRNRTLDEIEANLDRLMHRLIGLGGLEDAEQALRRVRRIVSRGIEE
jgi:hypothetical protein